MKKQSFETVLYSTLGVAAMALLLIAFNFIAGLGKQRLDLTHEKAYSLSDGTRAILAKLDTPIKIRFYCSQGDSSYETVQFRDYARQVEDLLDEYKQAAHGRITIEKYNPAPDSDAEDSARLDGVEPLSLRNGDPFYLGLSVSMLDEKQAVPFLDPSRERLLEYDLSRAISRVMTPRRPVVGIMSPLALFGTPANPMLMRMGQQQEEQPWVVVSELKNDFTVRAVPMETDKIDDDIQVLMVVQPRNISARAEYAIDQFVLRGGKLLAFLDPLPMFDTQENSMMGQMPNTGSSLSRLLRAWGLGFDTGKVVADMNFRMQMGGRNGQSQDAPGILSVTTDGINDEDIVTSQIDNLWLPYCGCFTGKPAEGLKETPLLESTKDSELIDSFLANMSAENTMRDFKASGSNYVLAVRLTGKFKTAFPGGKPGAEAAAEKTEEGTKAASKAEPALKESKQESSVILVGDADLLYDRVALQPVQSILGTTYTAANGNLAFAQNAVEQLSGDSNLISVRSRATLSRPFTRIRAMESAANEKFQTEIKRLQESADAVQQRVNELQQQKKDKDQRFILSPEQTAELTKLRKEEVETRKHLKQVQKDLRREVVALQTWVKWMNILAMPVAVAATGIVIAIVKRKKTAAK